MLIFFRKLKLCVAVFCILSIFKHTFTDRILLLLLFLWTDTLKYARLEIMFKTVPYFISELNKRDNICEVVVWSKFENYGGNCERGDSCNRDVDSHTSTFSLIISPLTTFL
jgi:hypothetical protein